jgi:CBS domain-containing protein
MHDRAIKRLPVVDGDGRLVGVISRSDVLRVFMRSDDEIRREIVEDVIRRTMLLDAPTLVISVTDGIVTATGEVDRKTDAEILTRLSAAVAGVVAVESHIRYRYDDEKQRGRPGVWSGTSSPAPGTRLLVRWPLCSVDNGFTLLLSPNTVASWDYCPTRISWRASGLPRTRNGLP